MLKGTKSMNLSYNSIINGKNVVYMSAQVPETGKSNCTMITLLMFQNLCVLRARTKMEKAYQYPQDPEQGPCRFPIRS